jgi:predicted enzyme related to lactoylglutathione lyase
MVSLPDRTRSWETDVAQIVWWEVETPDPEAFQRFHGQLWGWEYERAFADTELGADYWIIKHAGKGIGGLQRSVTGAQPQAGIRLYVEVDDLEEALQRVEALGGRIEQGRTALGGDDRWFATVSDPGGVSFGLWTAHEPAASTS